jgi:hypothetical protein
MKELRHVSESDGEMLRIKDFIYDEFPDKCLKIHLTSNNVIIRGTSLSDKFEVLDFKFKFFKIFGRKITDFNSNDLPEHSNISFNYS